MFCRCQWPRCHHSKETRKKPPRWTHMPILAVAIQSSMFPSSMFQIVNVLMWARIQHQLAPVFTFVTWSKSVIIQDIFAQCKCLFFLTFLMAQQPFIGPPDCRFVWFMSAESTASSPQKQWFFNASYVNSVFHLCLCCVIPNRVLKNSTESCSSSKMPIFPFCPFCCVQKITQFLLLLHLGHVCLWFCQCLAAHLWWPGFGSCPWCWWMAASWCGWFLFGQMCDADGITSKNGPMKVCPLAKVARCFIGWEMFLHMKMKWSNQCNQNERCTFVATMHCCHQKTSLEQNEVRMHRDKLPKCCAGFRDFLFFFSWVWLVMENHLGCNVRHWVRFNFNFFHALQCEMIMLHSRSAWHQVWLEVNHMAQSEPSFKPSSLLCVWSRWQLSFNLWSCSIHQE